MVFHVLNRGMARMQLFEKAGDYQAFEQVLRETAEEAPMRICANAVMPNHWHLIRLTLRLKELHGIEGLPNHASPFSFRPRFGGAPCLAEGLVLCAGRNLDAVLALPIVGNARSSKMPASINCLLTIT
jgi:hypothetical protein